MDRNSRLAVSRTAGSGVLHSRARTVAELARALRQNAYPTSWRHVLCIASRPNRATYHQPHEARAPVLGGRTGAVGFEVSPAECPSVVRARWRA